MSSTEQTIAHHIAAFSGRDLERIMSDYASDAVLIDPSGLSRGAGAIRGMFTGLIQSGIPLEPPTRTVIEGELAYLLWTAPPGKPGRQGSETLIVRGGKIVLQTVFDLGPPPGPPR